jgi:hypothetical protein
MTRISSGASLFHAAVQDLHAGFTDQAKRLPLDGHDPQLVKILRDEREAAIRRATDLIDLGLNPDGPVNLWMKGVLDDAERDTRSTEPGALLDIALAGAIRKGKVAEVAACDTALALGPTANSVQIVDLVAVIRCESQAAAGALLEVIQRLAI